MTWKRYSIVDYELWSHSGKSTQWTQGTVLCHLRPKAKLIIYCVAEGRSAGPNFVRPGRIFLSVPAGAYSQLADLLRNEKEAFLHFDDEKLTGFVSNGKELWPELISDPDTAA